MIAARVAAASLVVAACSGEPPSVGGAVGTAGAKAVIATMRAAEPLRAPWRCARMRATDRLAEDAFDAGGRRWTVADRTLRRAGAGEGIRLAVIADARGDSDPMRTALVRLPSRLSQVPAARPSPGPVPLPPSIDLLVAVGGMGATEAELVATLGPLAQGGWPVLAIPGDRESLPALRRAVAVLRHGGAAVVDGAAVRFVEVGGVALATLPGMPARERLGADADGCGHDDADLEAVLTALAARGAGKPRAPTVLLSPRAPRQGGDGSDLAAGGVHAGDLALARALAAHPVDLVVHGQIADRAIAAGRVDRGPVILSAGMADVAPRHDERGNRLPAQALVVSVDRRGGVRWQPVNLAP